MFVQYSACWTCRQADRNQAGIFFYDLPAVRKDFLLNACPTLIAHQPAYKLHPSYSCCLPGQMFKSRMRLDPVEDNRAYTTFLVCQPACLLRYCPHAGGLI
jgi:hypothetical protein